MKRTVKKERDFSKLHYYIELFRKQPEHMRHVYAVSIAATITIAMGMLILYFDYGFWREKYVRTEDVQIIDSQSVNQGLIEVETPTQMISNFVKEATVRFDGITSGSKELLNGKDVYKKKNSW